MTQISIVNSTLAFLYPFKTLESNTLSIDPKSVSQCLWDWTVFTVFNRYFYQSWLQLSLHVSRFTFIKFTEHSGICLPDIPVSQLDFNLLLYCNDFIAGPSSTNLLGFFCFLVGGGGGPPSWAGWRVSGRSFSVLFYCLILFFYLFFFFFWGGGGGGGGSPSWTACRVSGHSFSDIIHGLIPLIYIVFNCLKWNPDLDPVQWEECLLSWTSG